MQSVTKTIRLSGGSERSIEDAVLVALGRAALSISDIRSVDVTRVGGTVSDSGMPAEYAVMLDITFTFREGLHG